MAKGKLIVLAMLVLILLSGCETWVSADVKEGDASAVEHYQFEGGQTYITMDLPEGMEFDGIQTDSTDTANFEKYFLEKNVYTGEHGSMYVKINNVVFDTVRYNDDYGEDLRAKFDDEGLQKDADFSVRYLIDQITHADGKIVRIEQAEGQVDNHHAIFLTVDYEHDGGSYRMPAVMFLDREAAEEWSVSVSFPKDDEETEKWVNEMLESIKFHRR